MMPDRQVVFFNVPDALCHDHLISAQQIQKKEDARTLHKALKEIGVDVTWSPCLRLTDDDYKHQTWAVNFHGIYPLEEGMSLLSLHNGVATCLKSSLTTEGILERFVLELPKRPGSAFSGLLLALVPQVFRRGRATIGLPTVR